MRRVFVVLVLCLLCLPLAGCQHALFIKRITVGGDRAAHLQRSDGLIERVSVQDWIQPLEREKLSKAHQQRLYRCIAHAYPNWKKDGLRSTTFQTQENQLSLPGSQTVEEGSPVAYRYWVRMIKSPSQRVVHTSVGVTLIVLGAVSSFWGGTPDALSGAIQASIPLFKGDEGICLVQRNGKVWRVNPQASWRPETTSRQIQGLSFGDVVAFYRLRGDRNPTEPLRWQGPVPSNQAALHLWVNGEANYRRKLEEVAQRLQIPLRKLVQKSWKQRTHLVSFLQASRILPKQKDSPKGASKVFVTRQRLGWPLQVRAHFHQQHGYSRERVTLGLTLTPDSVRGVSQAVIAGVFPKGTRFLGWKSLPSFVQAHQYHKGGKHHFRLHIQAPTKGFKSVVIEAELKLLEPASHYVLPFQRLVLQGASSQPTPS